MLKVLIADDEPFIRQGLKCLIDWNAEGFDITAEAESGKEALNLIRSQKFDLIIADIRMPEMNGLELLEAVRQENISDAKFVILSGYFKYEYVKQAMKHNCTDYILKPVQKSELIQLLRNLNADFSEMKKNNDSQKIKEKALLDTHLLSLIWGKYDENDLTYVKSIIGDPKSIRYIGIEADIHDETYAMLNDSEKRKAGRKLFEICESVVASAYNPVVSDVSRHEAGYDIGIFYTPELAYRIGLSEDDYFTELGKCISAKYKYKIMMYTGNSVSRIEKISESFRSAVIAKTVNVFNDSEQVSYDNYIENLNKEQLDRLIKAVEGGDDDMINKCVDEVYNCINSMDYRLITLNIDYILYHFIYMAQELDRNINQHEVMQYIKETAFNIGTICGSKKNFKNFAFDFSKYIFQLRSGNFSSILLDVKNDIDENYAGNVSLKSLGEKYYINSAYLGQIFKKKYDISFKDYLNMVRIEEASKQILSCNEKIQNIAENVGYKSMDYFTKKFISIKGVTPTKLRKMKRELPT